VRPYFVLLLVLLFVVRLALALTLLPVLRVCVVATACGDEDAVTLRFLDFLSLSDDLDR